jgi:hypothetical protein
VGHCGAVRGKPYTAAGSLSESDRRREKVDMATVGAAPPAEESVTTITPEIIQKVRARAGLLAMRQRAGRPTHRATEPPPA